ncbi:hypothetical protein FQN50_007490 [Emmonsiellopsis sp. PD_5]|nr:hypothetical protein FQN50_007490 [Emmonsiellopsis sp. PD_5]
MGTPKYVPFKSPREVGWLMADLFDLYCSYQTDSFTFEWLRQTTDLEVHCEDTTAEKVDFPTSHALLEAIHKCEVICFPETARPFPSDYGFTGFIGQAIHEVKQRVPITEPELFRGPLFW